MPAEVTYIGGIDGLSTKRMGSKKTDVFLILMNIFCAFTKILPRKNEQIKCFSIFGIRFAKCMEILSYN